MGPTKKIRLLLVASGLTPEQADYLLALNRSVIVEHLRGERSPEDITDWLRRNGNLGQIDNEAITRFLGHPARYDDPPPRQPTRRGSDIAWGIVNVTSNRFITLTDGRATINSNSPTNPNQTT